MLFYVSSGLSFYCLWFVDLRKQEGIGTFSLFEVREVVAKSCVSFLCFVRVFICGCNGSKFCCWLTLIQVGF